MEFLTKCYQNILLLVSNVNKKKEYEIIENEDSIQDKNYWICIIGNKHPQSQKICKCYWESIKNEKNNLYSY